MTTMRTFPLIALLLGLGAPVASAQERHPCTVHDLRRGECSPGTEAPSRAALLAVIRSGAPTAVMSALEYAERVECYECVPLLARRLLDDDNAGVREFSAWWLRRRYFAVGGVIRQLKEVLANDPNVTRRVRAAEALGEMLMPTVLESLERAAREDRASEVRAAAVRALGRLNHPGGNATIAAAFSDADASVRLDALRQVLRVNFFRNHEALLPALADSDARVRRQAALVVGELRVQEAVEALAALLRGDENADVRQAAAWALGRIGGAAARSELQRAAESERASLVLDAIEVALLMRR
ncbi:MAG: HEAT repeat domain-containing protein [Myxococcales bacterium]|nr:HEAT repeat domain-containing protein [Myxococcales bacterium]